MTSFESWDHSFNQSIRYFQKYIQANENKTTKALYYWHFVLGIHRLSMDTLYMSPCKRTAETIMKQTVCCHKATRGPSRSLNSATQPCPLHGMTFMNCVLLLLRLNSVRKDISNYVKLFILAMIACRQHNRIQTLWFTISHITYHCFA